MKKIVPSLLIFFATGFANAQNVGIGTNTPLAKMDVNGAIALREGAALSLANGGASGGTNDNISLSYISGTTDISSFYRITGPTASFSVYGISRATGADGQIVTLINTSGKVMTIVNNGSSTAANSIITQSGGNLIDNASATASSSITLQYNKSVGKWYVINSQNFTISASSVTGSTVSNTSSANSMSTTVNGVTSATVPIINAHTLTQNGTNQLTSTVNGVSAGPTTLSVTGDVTGNLGAATVAGIEGKAITLTSLANNNILQYNSAGTDWVNVTPASILSGNTTHTLSSSGNTITSTVNGVGATAPAVNTVSNTSSANTLSTTVNGVTGSTMPIINTHTLTQNGTNQLTSTVNGVSAGPTTLNVTGDVTGNLGAATVAGIEGKSIAITSLANNNMLQYNGTSWVNVAPNASLISAWGLTGNSTVASNFIGTTGNNSFRMRTNNTERMVIDSLGNVGIGTTAPTTGMQVVDNYANKNVITVENTNSTGYSSVDFWDNTGALQGTFGYANAGVTNAALAGNTYFFSYGNDFAFGNSNNNNSLYIVGSNSNVGIGTSSPNYALDVAGDINTSAGFKISGGAGSGKYLRGNGTDFVSSAIQAGDIPTLNQNTTGNAATVTTNANLTGPVTSVGNATAIGANVVALGNLATLAANSIIANSTGSAATPTAVPLATTATGSSVAFRDANANITANNNIAGMTTTATAATTTTLTVTSTYMQQFTGTNTQTVVLPNATTLKAGLSFLVTNRSTGTVTVETSGGTTLQTMASGSQGLFTVITVASAAGTWDVAYSVTSAGGTTFANPTGAIGLTAVNGSATTAMRSDAAPALSQAIIPTWTNTHTFSGSTYSALFTGGSVGVGTATPTDKLQVNNGSIGIANSNNTAGSLKFYEPSGSGSNYTSFAAPALAANVTYTLPNADGSNGQILATNGSGALSWTAAANVNIGTAFALASASAANDPNSVFGGTYAEVGEIAVTVTSGDVLITSGYFSAEVSGASTLALRITRSTTSGSGSVGTVIAYSGVTQNGNNKYSSIPISCSETGVTAGTWYYKLWSTAYASGTQNYSMTTIKGL